MFLSTGLNLLRKRWVIRPITKTTRKVEGVASKQALSDRFKPAVMLAVIPVGSVVYCYDPSPEVSR
jgi:hypothetical protein